MITPIVDEVAGRTQEALRGTLVHAYEGFGAYRELFDELASSPHHSFDELAGEELELSFQPGILTILMVVIYAVVGST